MPADIKGLLVEENSSNYKVVLPKNLTNLIKPLDSIPFYRELGRSEACHTFHHQHHEDAIIKIQIEGNSYLLLSTNNFLVDI